MRRSGSEQGGDCRPGARAHLERAVIEQDVRAERETGPGLAPIAQPPRAEICQLQTCVFARPAGLPAGGLSPLHRLAHAAGI